MVGSGLDLFSERLGPLAKVPHKQATTVAQQIETRRLRNLQVDGQLASQWLANACVNQPSTRWFSVQAADDDGRHT